MSRGPPSRPCVWVSRNHWSPGTSRLGNCSHGDHSSEGPEIHTIFSDFKVKQRFYYKNELQVFLCHLSWKLKWAFLITWRSSCVRLSSVRLSINFSHFHLLLKNQWANFNQTSLKASFGNGDSSFLNERSRPFSRGYIYQIAKIHWQNLKIFFSRTTKPISTKLGTSILWWWGLKCVQIKGHTPFQEKIITKKLKHLDI